MIGVYGYQRLSGECPGVRSQSRNFPASRCIIPTRSDKVVGRQRLVAIHAFSGENSRGKLQNVVANSSAEFVQHAAKLLSDAKLADRVYSA